MSETPAQPARAFLVRLAIILIFASLLLNPALLGALEYSGTIQSPGLRTLIYAGEALLLLLGVAILALRSSPWLASFVGRLVGRQAGRLDGLFYAVYIVLTLEALSYVALFYLTPTSIRSRAFFTVALASDETSDLVPRMVPYLWSNYVPNPRHPHVNELGWRYGGGPRTHALRILCIGGSTTWSEAASAPENSYPARLEGYLRSEGYDVDVVNGGAPYYSSAELIGVLAFRGIYTEPDIVLIQTGENDVEPLLLPGKYEPDYSHWRVARSFPSFASSRDDLFAMIWRVPSWTVRFFATMGLQPDATAGLKLGRQAATTKDAFFATNDISDRYPEGVARNLRTLVGISRVHGAVPVTILTNAQTDRLHVYFRNLLEDPELYRRVKERAELGYRKTNEALRNISEELGVPVIPFGDFAPSSANSWVDHVHLDDQGDLEKAVFIGRWLIRNGILEEALQGGMHPAGSGNLPRVIDP